MEFRGHLQDTAGPIPLLEEVRGKACQAGALLTRLPKSNVGWSCPGAAPRHGMGSGCHRTASPTTKIPSASPQAAWVPSPTAPGCSGRQGWAALPLTASASSSLLWKPRLLPAPPREKRKSRVRAAARACRGELAPDHRKPLRGPRHSAAEGLRGEELPLRWSAAPTGSLAGAGTPWGLGEAVSAAWPQHEWVPGPALPFLHQGHRALAAGWC